MTHRRMRNIAQEKAYVELMMRLDDQALEERHRKLKQALVPEDWRTIERDVPVRPKKEKLTAAFDADMLKWFRAMGHGYQARMNAVLRTYMLALISKEILSRGDKDWKHDEIWGVPDRRPLD